MAEPTLTELEQIPGTVPYFERQRERAKAGLCTNCGKRPASKRWGNSLAATHGWTEKRCGVCVYGPQLRHAAGRVPAVPVLAVKFLIAWVRRA